MAKKTKDKRLILIVAAVVLALILVNVFLFLNKPSPVYCYKDICIKGQEDPLAEIDSLIKSSTKAIIVVEEDQNNASQKNDFLIGAFVSLSKDFGNKKEQIVGIAMKDGVPVRCVCTNFNGENFTDCRDNSTSYCEGIVPGQDEIMLKVYYPIFSSNEIIIENRTIKFQAKSGQDALAMTNFFGDFFIRKVIR